MPQYNHTIARPHGAVVAPVLSSARAGEAEDEPQPAAPPVLSWWFTRRIPWHRRIALEHGTARYFAPRLALALSIVLAAAAGAAAIQPLPPVQIQQIRLANGLKAVLVQRKESPVVTLEVWYHVGSKNEAPGMAGFAHLFEHLMFDGTKELGRDQFSRYIVGAGGVDNAYTTVDATVFWETIPSGTLPLALWLEADRMRNLMVTEKTFDTEREVVEEERRFRLDSQPYGTMIERLYQNAFTVSPYRHLPIGNMKDIERAKLSEVRAFYDRYYVPNNATLVVVGDFSRARAERLIREDFGPLKPSRNPIPREFSAEPPQTHERIVKLRQQVALPAFVMGYHIPADGTPDSYALRLLVNILSEGDSSLIYRRLVYQEQIALEAEAEGNFTEEPNLFLVFAVMNSGHTDAQGEAAMAAILDRLRERPARRATLDKAKRQILFRMAKDLETTRREADELGYDAVILRHPGLINSAAGRFLAVTRQEIQSAARKYFRRRNLTLIEVDPSRPGGVERPAAGAKGGSR